jgi:hypothetical protein
MALNEILAVFCCFCDINSADQLRISLDTLLLKTVIVMKCRHRDDDDLIEFCQL